MVAKPQVTCLNIVMNDNVNILELVRTENGEFGKYQRRTCFYILIASALIYFSSVIFVYEAKEVNHRCKINGCDSKTTEFRPSWWSNAAPTFPNRSSACIKYLPINNDSCEISDFNHSVEMKCETFVYETAEVSILQDYNLHCDENLWKLTLVGTIHNFGTFVGLPISGVLSDKFGRRTLLINGMVLSGIMGLLRSFANSYILFLILEFLDAFCISGAYGTVWILGVEYVGPENRVFITVLISSCFAIGGVIQALIAWKVQSWRILLQILYSLQLIVVFYQWLIPESTWWLLSKRRFSEVKKTLETIAEVNGKVQSEDFSKVLNNCDVSKRNAKTNSIVDLFHSSILVVRFFNCVVCWICCIFIYYGFTVNSVQLSSNTYLDIILTVLVEIPGTVVYIIADRIGRRISLSSGFIIVTLSCFVSLIPHSDQQWFLLTFHLLGKFGISISISVLYTVTTELFPTPFRNTLLSTCIMSGGFGAMAAPQLPLLKSVWDNLPTVLFGSAGIVASILSLLLPETKNLDLPGTIEEAENIGKCKATVI